MHHLIFFLLPILAISLLFLIRKQYKNNARKPPGPPGLPIIGSLHSYVSSSTHLYFYQLSKTYGPLVSLNLGFVPTLVVSSAKMAKEVLKTRDHIFCSRPKLTNLQKISYNGLAMTFAPYNDYWRAMRKLSAIHLFSSKKVQSFSWIREEEVGEITRKIACLSAEDRPVNLSEMMMYLTNTIICRTAFGDVGRDKVSFQDICRETQRVSVSFQFSDYFPLMGWLDKLTGLSAKVDKAVIKLDGILEDIVNEHVGKVRPESGVEDIVDVLLGLQKDNQFGEEITHDHIKAIVMEVYLAGTDTSSATVVLAMTELMKNPEAMKRVQEEVRSSTRRKTKDNMVREEDLEELVYLKAVMKETMRLHPVVPLLVPRVATQNSTIQGYEIQEKTLVFVNAWAIGRDPESRENPEEFRPERFMGDDPVDFRGQDMELIPFGSGRRICPGMQMGVAMVELALANLVYSFDWTVPVGMEEQVLDTSVLPGTTTHKRISLCLLAKSVA